MLFAHDGRVTWDEWLFVLVPLALFAVVIWRARIRAERETSIRAERETSIRAEREHEQEHEPSDP